MSSFRSLNSSHVVFLSTVCRTSFEVPRFISYSQVKAFYFGLFCEEKPCCKKVRLKVYAYIRTCEWDSEWFFPGRWNTATGSSSGGGASCSSQLFQFAISTNEHPPYIAQTLLTPSTNVYECSWHVMRQHKMRNTTGRMNGTPQMVQILMRGNPNETITTDIDDQCARWCINMNGCCCCEYLHANMMKPHSNCAVLIWAPFV